MGSKLNCYFLLSNKLKIELEQCTLIQPLKNKFHYPKSLQPTHHYPKFQIHPKGGV